MILHRRGVRGRQRLLVLLRLRRWWWCLRLRWRSHLLGRLSVNLLLLLTGWRSGRLLPLLRLALVVNRLRRLRLLWRRLRLHRRLWLHRRLGLRRWLLHGCLWLHRRLLDR